MIDLNEIVEGMATMLSRMLGEDVDPLDRARPGGSASTLADPTQLEQVVLNLALNARDAMPKGGSLVICDGARSSSASTTSDRTPISSRART